MKNKIYKFLAASLVILGTSACNEASWETEFGAGQGAVDLSDMAIDVNDSETVVTRATVDVNDFSVVVTDKNGKEMGSYIYGSMPEILTLPAGEDYNIFVESHDIQDAEWDKPYYKGTEKFSITSGKITQIGAITASFSSLKVSVKFSDELKKILGQNAKVVVKGTNGAELSFSPSETRSGYFAIEGSHTFAAHFSGTIDGVATTTETPFTEVEAGQHHILTYSIKGTPDIPEQSGDFTKPSIEVDVKYDVEQKNGNANVEEDIIPDTSDRPGQEDPQKPEDPSQPNPPGTPDEPQEPENPDEGNYIVFTAKNSPNLHLNEINLASGDFGNAIINISVPKGIKDFKVDISSTDSGFIAAIDEFHLQSFDLINPDPEAKSSLEELKLPFGEQVKDKEEIDFDITSFIMFLQYPGVHTFKMTVSDGEHTGVLPLMFTSKD